MFYIQVGAGAGGFVVVLLLPCLALSICMWRYRNRIKAYANAGKEKILKKNATGSDEQPKGANSQPKSKASIANESQKELTTTNSKSSPGTQPVSKGATSKVLKPIVPKHV